MRSGCMQRPASRWEGVGLECPAHMVGGNGWDVVEMLGGCPEKVPEVTEMRCGCMKWRSEMLMAICSCNAGMNNVYVADLH